MSDDNSALSVHVVFFDVNGDGEITRSEIRQAMIELGFSKIVAALVAPVLAIALPPGVAENRDLRHADSGAIDAGGEFDEAAFLDWFKSADTDKSGTLSKMELLKSSLRIADGPSALVASIGEFQLVHMLLADDHGLHRDDVKRFLNGDLFRDLIRQREQG